MLTKKHVVCLALAVCFVSLAGAEEAAKVVPLPRAHSHNDYDRKEPLQEALRRGYCSVEADVFQVDGDLLVAHDFKDVDPAKNLRAMYLDPLAKIARENGGHIYAPGLPFILLVDFKSAGEKTWPVLKEQLAEYADILTEFTDEKTTTRAVTVIISGSSPADLVGAEPVRFAGIDGRVNDLATQSNPNLYPMISDSWLSQIRWFGKGDMPGDQAARLNEIVEAVHKNNQILRFWAIPAREAAWAKLYDAGVDLINADDLEAVQTFLLKRKDKE